MYGLILVGVRRGFRPYAHVVRSISRAALPGVRKVHLFFFSVVSGLLSAMRSTSQCRREHSAVGLMPYNCHSEAYLGTLWFLGRTVVVATREEDRNAFELRQKKLVMNTIENGCGRWDGERMRMYFRTGGYSWSH